jgi:hypothetical protein
MRAVRWLFQSLLVLAILLAPRGSADAQSTETLYFPETGHNVRGEFLKHYNSVKDPKLVYGYPITEQITSRDGRIVQYFQRARFELGTDLLGNLRVQLTPIGQAIYKPGGQLNINNASGCQLFMTGHHVCFAFLDFYQANGGMAQFGNPISPFEYRENLIVQYFEMARFEWRADRPEGQRVAITDLGRAYFDQLGEDQAHLKPVNPLDATINPVLSLKVRAFVSKSITLSSGRQTVYIIVQNQTLQAVSNASGKVSVRWPGSQTEEYFLATNNAGIGSVTFDFASQKQGELVPIDIIVEYQGITAKTKTSFRIWF